MRLSCAVPMIFEGGIVEFLTELISEMFSVKNTDRVMRVIHIPICIVTHRHLSMDLLCM